MFKIGDNVKRNNSNNVGEVVATSGSDSTCIVRFGESPNFTHTKWVSMDDYTKVVKVETTEDVKQA